MRCSSINPRRRHRGRQVQDLRLRQRQRVLVVVTEGLRAKTVDERCASKNTQIVEVLNLPPVMDPCSVLAKDAIKSAIADFRRKQAERRARQALPAAQAEQSARELRRDGGQQ
jgi:hypothetical protein